MKLEPGIGSPPIPTAGRLAEAVVGGLLNRFIGQGAGTGNDAHFTRLV